MKKKIPEKGAVEVGGIDGLGGVEGAPLGAFIDLGADDGEGLEHVLALALLPEHLVAVQSENVVQFLNFALVALLIVETLGIVRLPQDLVRRARRDEDAALHLLVLLKKKNK